MLAYASWAQMEPWKGTYDWRYVDDIADQIRRYGLKPVIRIDRPPAWASGTWQPKVPPANPDDFGDFMAALVQHMGNRVAGYVIFNEPNLRSEWGGQVPDAAQYMQILRAAYGRAKAVNPKVTIVSAPLAPGGPSTDLVKDADFLQQMYDQGLKNAADVIGLNALGFKYAPDDRSDPYGMSYANVETLRSVMVANGDSGKQVWVLEMGWLLDTATELGGWNWAKVSESQRSAYLTRAFEKAFNEWPWTGVLFVWNLDFSVYAPASSDGPEMPYFSLLNVDGSPRPSYYALAGAPKPPATYTPTASPTSTATPTPARVYIPLAEREYNPGW